MFGSVGDFFDVDFDKLPGGWSINPPFIERLMNATVDKILKALDKKPQNDTPLYFMVCFPHWPDNEGWIKLNESKHTLDRRHYKKRSYVLEKAYGNKILPYCPLSHFVLGQLPKNLKKPVSHLHEVMMQTYEMFKHQLE